MPTTVDALTFNRPATTDPPTVGAAALRYVLQHGHAADLTDAELRHAAAAAIVARAPRALHPAALENLNTAAEWIAKTQDWRAAQLAAFAATEPADDAGSPAPPDASQPDTPPETDADLVMRAMQAIIRIAGRPPGDDDHPGGGARVPLQPRPKAPAPSTYAPTPTPTPAARAATLKTPPTEIDF